MRFRMKMSLHSRLSQKLFKQYVTVYSRIFVILALAVLSGSLFIIQKNTSRNVRTSMSAILDTLTAFQDSLYQKSVSFSSDELLRQDLEVFLTDGTSSSRSKVCLDLRSLTSADSSLFFISVELPDGTTLGTAGANSESFLRFIQSRDEYADLTVRNTSLLSSFYDKSVLSDYTAAEASVLSTNEYLPSSFCLYYTRVILSGHSVMMTFMFDVSALIRSCLVESDALDGLFLYNSRNTCVWQYLKKTVSCNVPDRFSLLTPSNGILLRDGYYYLKNDYSSIYAVGFVSIFTLLWQILVLLIILILLYIFPLVIALFYLFPVNERMLSPLYQLNEGISSFSIGSEIPAPIRSRDEIEDLSRSFQQMALNINNQAAELTAQEHEKALTYYKLMTTQLDPHFIYNTMNIINILARQQDYEGIIKVNTALTRVLRERLNTQNTTFSPVNEEIRTLEQYLLIMDYRYHQQVAVDFEIDEEIQEELIPKNILQPLVENAYYHGLVKTDGSISGNIGIFIYSDQEGIIIEVSDDGSGFDTDYLAYLKAHNFQSPYKPKKDTHIGIENIHQRLSYLYGDRFSMDILSDPDQGATFILSLPYVKKNPDIL